MRRSLPKMSFLRILPRCAAASMCRFVAAIRSSTSTTWCPESSRLTQTWSSFAEGHETSRYRGSCRRQCGTSWAARARCANWTPFFPASGRARPMAWLSRSWPAPPVSGRPRWRCGGARAASFSWRARCSYRDATCCAHAPGRIRSSAAACTITAHSPSVSRSDPRTRRRPTRGCRRHQLDDTFVPHRRLSPSPECSPPAKAWPEAHNAMPCAIRQCHDPQRAWSKR